MDEEQGEQGALFCRIAGRGDLVLGWRFVHHLPILKFICTKHTGVKAIQLLVATCPFILFYFFYNHVVRDALPSSQGPFSCLLFTIWDFSLRLLLCAL